MTITMPYNVYKDLIEKCKFFDKDGNEIQVIQTNYSGKPNHLITLEFTKTPTKAIIE